MKDVSITNIVNIAVESLFSHSYTINIIMYEFYYINL